MHSSFLLLAVAVVLPCCAQINLPDRRDYQIPAGAQYIVHGDFNNDGVPDIAVSAGTGLGYVSVLLGNGDGTFQQSIDTHAGLDPSGIAAADFNGDGNLDLVVLPSDSLYGALELFLGNGDGTFQAPQRIAIPTTGTCWYVVSADLNHDNKPDLIIAFAGLNEVLILLGNGDGTFQTPELLDGGAYFTLGDFNNDGNLDIATSRTFYSPVFSVLLGNGDGTFQPPIVNTYFGAPLASGDLNGDGVPDLVLNINSETFAVALGNGDGTFQQPVSVPYQAKKPFEALIPALADFDGDGHLDLAILTQLDPIKTRECCSVSVLKGNGDGTFGAPNEFQVGPFDSVAVVTAISIADFNGDGRPDIAVPGGAVSVLLNLTPSDGTVTLSDPVDRVSYGAANSGEAPASIATGKFNNGKSPVFQDIAVTSAATNQVFVIPVSDAIPGTPQPFAVGTSPAAVAVADLRNDKKLDLITANSGSNDVSVLLGDGNGGFAAAVSFPAGTGPSALAVGDFNHDGNADLAIADASTASITILLGNGAGGFFAPLTIPSVANPNSITVGDFDQDGVPDLAVGSSTSSSVSILIGAGNGSFMPGPVLTAPAAAVSLASADFRANGTQDLIVTATPGSVYVALGNGDGTFQTWTQHVVPPTPSSIGFGDFNGDGHLDFITSNSTSNDISVFLGDGSGRFSESINFGADFSALALTVADFRHSGKPDVAVSNPVDNRVTILLNPFPQ